MGHFFNSTNYNRMGTALLLMIFSCTAILPPAVLKAEERWEDIAAGIRILNLSDKAKKYLKNMDGKHLLQCMYELKDEVEGYTGSKIDIEKALDYVFQEVKKKGKKIDKSYEKTLKEMFKKHKVRFDHKKEFQKQCFINNIAYDDVLENLEFIAKHKDDHSKDEKVEVRLPIRLVIGITATLCGVFLLFVPHPGAQVAAGVFLGKGTDLISEALLRALEEEEEKERRR